MFFSSEGYVEKATTGESWQRITLFAHVGRFGKYQGSCTILSRKPFFISVSGSITNAIEVEICFLG
jgi:hypothetical protein